MPPQPALHRKLLINLNPHLGGKLERGQHCRRRFVTSIRPIFGTSGRAQIISMLAFFARATSIVMRSFRAMV